MKKLICLFLAMAAVFALAAGCSQGGLVIGETTATTREVGAEELSNVAGQLEGAINGVLDTAMQSALQDALARGVTIPAETAPLETLPPPMPEGSQVSADQLRPLMEQTLKILGGETFTLKARGASPMAGPAGGTTALTMVMDKDKTAFEVDMDWINMFKAMTAGTPEAGLATIRGASMQTFFGKKLRFLSVPGNEAIVFLDKKTYTAFSADAEAEASGMPVDMAGSLGGMFTPNTEVPENLNASKVSMNGKDYMCATLVNEDGSTTMRYYFLNSELKRIEMQGEGETVIWEIDEIKATADPSFFSTAGMKKVSFEELGDLTGSLGTLFGG